MRVNGAVAHEFGMADAPRATPSIFHRQTVDSSSNRLISKLGAIAVPVLMARGEILFQTGDPGEGVYLLRTGRVALTRTGDQQHYPMGTLGPGSLIGLPAVLNGMYSLTAQALEASSLGYVSGRQVISLLERSPRLLSEATKMLAHELARVRSVLAWDDEDQTTH
jgi:CRP-like cAMP-binding protein